MMVQGKKVGWRNAVGCLYWQLEGVGVGVYGVNR